MGLTEAVDRLAWQPSCIPGVVPHIGARFEEAKREQHTGEGVSTAIGSDEWVDLTCLLGRQGGEKEHTEQAKRKKAREYLDIFSMMSRFPEESRMEPAEYEVTFPLRTETIL